jgi:hypothetical protein
MGNLAIAAGLVAFGVVAGAYPIYLVSKSASKTNIDDPLNRQLAIRGAYMNTGSKDAGRLNNRRSTPTNTPAPPSDRKL